MSHNHIIIDSDGHYIIDPITRAITNQSGKTTIMQYDHNSERLTFEVNPIIEGHNMSECNRVEVHYINLASDKRSQNKGFYTVEDLKVEDDKLTFSWLISRNATQLPGILSFVIRFICDENGIEVYSFNTAKYETLTISESINNTETIVEEYQDILEQWRKDVLAVNTYIADVEDQLEVKADKSYVDGEIKKIVLENGGDYADDIADIRDALGIISVKDVTWRDGHYVIYYNNGMYKEVSPGTLVQMLSEPIKVYAGDVVTLKTQVGPSYSAITITDEKESVYTPVVQGQNANSSTLYEYTVEKNCYIVVACIYLASKGMDFSININGNKSKEIEDIKSTINTYLTPPVIKQIIYPDFEVKSVFRGSHDCTFIGDYLVSFNKASDGKSMFIKADTLTEESNKRKTINFTEPSTSKELELKSCDYKFGKLLVGNGRAIKYNEADYYEQGAKLYVFYNADNWVNGTEDITFDNCGDYDIIDISELGYKVYGFWGQFDDCVFVSCNLFNDIYLIQLGKGTSNLGKGTYAETDVDKYNGSYMIINHWHQDGALGEYAGHGGQYYKGHLYIATNDGNLCTIYKCILNNSGKLEFEALNFDVKDPTDTNYLKYRYIDGMCIKDDVLYAQPLTEGKNGSSNKNMIVAKL
jgi:hypothetical protein